MTKTLTLSKLTGEPFLREMHHFLWSDPVWSDGTLDQGWNCRDHAWITSLLVHTMGHRPVLFRGRSFIIGGPTNIHNGFAVYQPQHAWVGVKDLGVIDLSIKTEVTMDTGQHKVPVRCVLGDSAVPRERAKLYVMENPAEFGRAASLLAQQRKQTSLLYLIENGEELNEGHLTSAAEWIHSPLTEHLTTLHRQPADLYCALFLHLHAFLLGETDGFAAKNGDDPWIQLAESGTDALQRTVELLNTATALPPAPTPQPEDESKDEHANPPSSKNQTTANRTSTGA